MVSAIDHGVFNPVEPGTIVSASLAPSGGSYLTMMFFVWGIFWSCYWVFSLIYGLAKGWDQQQLAYHLSITLITYLLCEIAAKNLTLALSKRLLNKTIDPAP